MNTKYEYECLVIDDADAIIIRQYHKVNDEIKSFIILIDAGTKDNGVTVAQHLQKYYDTKHINLAICTHPDSDHKEGFFSLLDDKEVTIDEFWLTDPAKFLKPEYITDKKAIECVRRIWNNSDNSRNLISELEERHVKLVSVTAGKQIRPIITVVAPSRKLYMAKIVEILKSDGKKGYSKVDSEKYDEEAIINDNDAASVMNDCTDESPTNASSIVILYEPEPGRKFLFAGDSTQESIQEAIRTYGIANVDYLKVPHHGSKHNLTTAIIDTLQPKTSCITASGSKKHPSNAIVYWLSKYGDVYSTHKSKGYLHWRHNVPPREDSISIDPLKSRQ